MYAAGNFFRASCGALIWGLSWVLKLALQRAVVLLLERKLRLYRYVEEEHFAVPPLHIEHDMSEFSSQAGPYRTEKCLKHVSDLGIRFVPFYFHQSYQNC